MKKTLIFGVMGLNCLKEISFIVLLEYKLNDGRWYMCIYMCKYIYVQSKNDKKKLFKTENIHIIFCDIS